MIGKDGPFSLWRPAALKQEDFVDVIKEVVPQLVEDACMEQSKRPRSPTMEASEPAASRPRLEPSDESLSVQAVSWLYHAPQNSPT